MNTMGDLALTSTGERIAEANAPAMPCAAATSTCPSAADAGSRTPHAGRQAHAAGV
ncbi:hypothetical protein ACGLHS_25110 [Variovorax sp. VaC1]|uniref:hypothetical protein n=1 Tax=Variovorax sp. VaC1 TaxID=3373132 RepID=UPI0037487F8F